MTQVAPIRRSDAEGVAALWRALHPDWIWLDDPGQRAGAFEPGQAFDRIGYVVRRADAVIATVFGTLSLRDTRPRTRFMRIEARPEDIAAQWLDGILALFVDADRGHPDAWHVVQPAPPLAPVLAPVLEAARYVRRGAQWRIEWSGDFVAPADPGTAHFERYAGGSPETDRAIADLHNRAYRGMRLVPPVDPETLWPPSSRLSVHEYLLTLQDGRVIGYAEWFEADGELWVNSFAVDRSHWGTSIGPALAAKVMHVVIEAGYRRMVGMVRSNNPAIMRLWEALGWKLAGELYQIFVREN